MKNHAKKLISVLLAVTLAASGCGTKSGEIAADTETVQMEGEVILYTGNENGDGFTEISVVLEEITPENIIAALSENRVLPDTVEVLDFAEDGDALTIDLSKEYQEYVSSSGTSGELIAVGGVGNTFLAAYNAATITILVEGNAWDTGHAEYGGPLGWYEY